MISLTNSVGQQTASFGGGSQYGMATGRTANFNYGTLGAGPKQLGHSMGMSSAATRAPAQLSPTEAIGMAAAKAPQTQQQQQQSSGGGGGGRAMSFMKGLGEGAPAEAGAGEAGAGAGAGEAAAGSSAIAELAPLALAAL
jgi:hypothetical protein